MNGGKTFRRARLARLVLGGSMLTAGIVAAAALPSDAARPRASSAPLEIAVFSPFTGPNAEYGYFNYDGCVSAVTLVDQSGGVQGHDLSCKIVDNRGDPADAVPAAQNMVAGSSNLVGEVDGNSGLLSATVPILCKAHLVEMSLGGDPAFDKNTCPYFWRTTPGDDQAGYALAAYIKFDTHYTKIAALFGNDVAAQGNVPGLLAGTKNLGLKIVSNQALALDQTSYASEAQKLKSAHPQVIVTESDPQTAGVLFANLKQAGALLPLVGTSGTVGTDYNKASIAAIGSKAYTKGFVRIIQYTATAGPAFDVWKRGVAAAKGIKSKSAVVTGFAPEVAYDHVTMEALAMVAAHSTVGSVYDKYVAKITEGKVVVHSFAQGKAALAKGESIDFVGLEGQISFNRYHNSAGIWSVDNPVTNATEKTISASDMAKALGH